MWDDGMDDSMILKQLYITRAQEAALKGRSRREAAVLRFAIDRHLLRSANDGSAEIAARHFVVELRTLSEDCELRLKGGFVRKAAYYI
jgi:hypothetical protein